MKCKTRLKSLCKKMERKRKGKRERNNMHQKHFILSGFVIVLICKAVLTNFQTFKILIVQI